MENRFERLLDRMRNLRVYVGDIAKIQAMLCQDYTNEEIFFAYCAAKVMDR